MTQLCLPLQLPPAPPAAPARSVARPLPRNGRRTAGSQQLVFAYPYSPHPHRQPHPHRRRRLHPRHHPHAAAHALALAHLDLAEKIAGNFARRTTHPFDDLRQLAVIGLLKAADRFDPSGGRCFRPYARSFANGEITHYLRDHGFAIKVPPTWRDLYASGQKLLRQGLAPQLVPQRLGITAARWAEIVEACSISVVALPLET
jgi:DNA-directed RNA polymerase sigma subunit (sigma70/sigma32)